jgi:choline dehydrogenase-like flavoprotein
MIPYIARPVLKNDRQQQLINATLVSVEHHRLPNTTRNRISGLTAMLTGIVNHYFGSKQGIIQASQKFVSDNLMQALLTTTSCKNVPPVTRLSKSVAANLTEIQGSNTTTKNYVNFWSQAINASRLASLQNINSQQLYAHRFFSVNPSWPTLAAVNATKQIAVIAGFWLSRSLNIKPFTSSDVIDSKAAIARPDWQYHHLLAVMHYDGKNAFLRHGFQAHIGHNKPKNCPTATVVSNDTQVASQIQFNYLSHQNRIEGFSVQVHLIREFVNQMSVDQYRGEPIQANLSAQTNEEIERFVTNAVERADQPTCSCKMSEDNMMIVHSETKVHGINRLHVVDLSISPTIPNGHLSSPTMMVAEQGTEFILGAQPQPPPQFGQRYRCQPVTTITSA